MMYIDPISGILWLSTGELGRYYHRNRQSINYWLRIGLVTQLGFIVKVSPSKYRQIGIPLAHKEYDAILATVQNVH